MDEYTCPKHYMKQDSLAWQQGMTIMTGLINPSGLRALEPCPGCLDEMVGDFKEAHETLDALQIPRRGIGKHDLSITDRLLLLFSRLDGGEKLSEMRTS